MIAHHAAGGRQKGGGRITPFGQKCRELRKSQNLLLIDMAHIAGVSPGFLSLVETGQKSIPDRLVTKLVESLNLTDRQAGELRNAAALSAKEFRITVKSDADFLDRRLAHALETGFAKMTPLKKQRLLDLLEKE